MALLEQRGAGAGIATQKWLEHVSVPKLWAYNFRRYPLVINIAMENGPFIDGFPIKNGDFP